MEHALRFSTKNPFLQVKLNSSSLGEFQQCERKYFYSTILGLRRKGLQKDLDFGTLAHEGRQVFYKLRVQLPYEKALKETLKHILPKAESQLSYESPKNPHSLGRFLVWYFDKYERNSTGPKTVAITGEPAVEVNFEFPTGLHTEAGEDITIFGTIDRFAQVGDQIYPDDLKTTSQSLGLRFAESFSPDIQFTLYVAATEILTGWKADSLILHGAQIGQTFVRLENFVVPRPKAVLEEFLKSLRYYLLLMQLCAAEAFKADSFASQEAAYPQRAKNCSLYGGCQFRKICARAPAQRVQILSLEFQPRAESPKP